MQGASAAALRVLLIEDNPGDAALVDELLAGSPGPAAQILHASSLAAANAHLGQGDVDVVLLDLGLPDARGAACVQHVRGRAPQVPIVVLTGTDDHELALTCIAEGAQDYLAKNEVRAESLRRSLGYAIARTREQAERRRANAATAHLAAIVEASADAIVSTTTAGIATSWNRGAEAMFGYSAAEAIGQPFGALVRSPPDTTATSPTGEFDRLHRDGHTITLSGVVSPLHDDAGAVVGHAAIYRNISERRRREAEIRAQNALLVARDAEMRALTERLTAVREDERTRIARTVHDELGQLLTGLKLDLRWLARRLAPDAAAPITDRLAEAERLTDRTLETVQRIALELRPSVLDALGLVAAIRDEARRFEHRAGLALEVRLDAPTPPPERIATAMFRIFQELLTNVARHAQARAVTVGLDEVPEAWVLTVADDGIGFQPSDAPRSLGLLGMRERAAALGGRVELRSRAGIGTIATVHLPRTAAEPS
ncbi:MAG: PAS domain S-box protein [Deltaproteobacteria bacterium]|nr:PAS domain S-box protein [Deltaproteobacteria bacterium]